MTKLEYMANVLWKIARKMKIGKYNVGEIYQKFWNPINYALVGGLGLLINYFVFALLIARLPWWIVNFIAILCAWTWNWSMSVGPFGWMWGFKPRR